VYDEAHVRVGTDTHVSPCIVQAAVCWPSPHTAWLLLLLLPLLLLLLQDVLVP
jgi:hypothetical protein